ncbi:calpain-B-like [Aedes albopictus]|uniref:Calpain catalytic domain-containing protein n=1 Tax=Aedes albopictus TaxID=7160 RepID=A0ABM1ZC35_AEDAL|nr:calpain-B-like [Aedes albopictus]
MDRDCDCSPSCSRLSPFIVVEFTEDGISYNSPRVHQNPHAQRFYHLRDHCLANNLLFEDPDFKVEEQPLIGYKLSTKSKLKWLRPSEIVDDPQFVVLNEPSDFDVHPGYLPSGSLITSMLNLFANKRSFQRTVPHDNSFADEEYAGIFHFHFWDYGRWIDVVIDDRLPTLDGKLLFTRSARPNELWCSLLEKAYAKFLGSYNALKGVTISETMQDFAGGVTQCYWFKECKLSTDYFYALIEKGLQRGSMIAGIRLHNKVNGEDRSCITNPITQTMSSGSRLVCLGNFGDQVIRSEEDEAIEDHPKRYWLCIEQFMSRFDGVELCSTAPDLLRDPERGQRNWRTLSYEGIWVSGLTAGGCKDHRDSYGMNPRFKMDLSKPDTDAGLCSVVISLMQKQRTGMVLCLVIGFEVLSHRNKTVAQSIYSNAREVTSRLQLPPGSYTIIPTTKQPDQNGAFLLRIFTEPRAPSDSTDGFEVIHPAHSLLRSGTWESMVRMFFELANHFGIIDTADMAVIISEYFVESQPQKRKQKNWPIFSNPQSKPVKLSINKNIIRSAHKHHAIQRALTEHIAQMQRDRRRSLNFEQFLDILAENCYNWQQMFSLVEQ